MTFPLFAKIDVNGEKAHPLYVYLKKEKSGFLGTEAIKWNFTKFLIDRKGNVVKRYGSSTKPAEITNDIEEIAKIMTIKKNTFHLTSKEFLRNTVSDFTFITFLTTVVSSSTVPLPENVAQHCQKREHSLLPLIPGTSNVMT